MDAGAVRIYGMQFCRGCRALFQPTADFCLDLRGEEFARCPHRQTGTPEEAPAHFFKRLHGVAGEKRRAIRRRGNGGCQTGIPRYGSLHREGAAFQIQPVKEVASVGGVHQQEADSCVLLLRKFLRPQPPEIPKG